MQNNYADRKKPDEKEILHTSCMISLYRIVGNANKYLVTESRAVFAQWGLRSGNARAGLRGRNYKGPLGNFWGNKYIHYVDFDGGIMNIYILQNVSNEHFKYVWFI